MDINNSKNKELIDIIGRIDELNSTNFDDYSVQTLINFLESSHRRFVNQSIPKIEQNFLLLVKFYEESNQIKTIFNLFLRFQIEFMQHIQIEERTFFPYVKTLYEASKSNSLATILLIHFGKYTVSDFVDSHEDKEPYLTEIIFLLEQQKGLKKHPVFNILLKQLCQLDNEIKTHAGIEDGVLIQKIVKIENAISSFVKLNQN